VNFPGEALSPFGRFLIDRHVPRTAGTLIGFAGPRLLIDMIEEYARHVGHADLIRESVDGLVGEDPPGDHAV
jgi:Protein of unknown function (DUF664)